MTFSQIVDDTLATFSLIAGPYFHIIIGFLIVTLFFRVATIVTRAINDPDSIPDKYWTTHLPHYAGCPRPYDSSYTENNCIHCGYRSGGAS
ncbi:MAG TPA: hypothetical protein VLL52_22490 [Anaerolineae bacterium]|nr:hypothetical protein [Anaerolineae bacterium]